MGKSRGNRLCKQGAYFYWLDSSPVNVDYAYLCGNNSWQHYHGNMPAKIWSNSSITFRGNDQLKTLPKIGQQKTFHNFAQNCTALEVVDFGTDKINLVGASMDYQFMFDGCTSLQKVLNLPLKFTDSYSSAYYMIFNNCTSLTQLSFRDFSEIGGEFDLSVCPLDDDSVLATAYILSTKQYHQSTLKLNSSTATTQSTKHVKLNSNGKGLVFCNAGDDGDLGTLSEYITNKGWTLTLV